MTPGLDPLQSNTILTPTGSLLSVSSELSCRISLGALPIPCCIYSCCNRILQSSPFPRGVIPRNNLNYCPQSYFSTNFAVQHDPCFSSIHNYSVTSRSPASRVAGYRLRGHKGSGLWKVWTVPSPPLPLLPRAKFDQAGSNRLAEARECGAALAISEWTL